MTTALNIFIWASQVVGIAVPVLGLPFIGFMVGMTIAHFAFLGRVGYVTLREFHTMGGSFGVVLGACAGWMMVVQTSGNPTLTTTITLGAAVLFVGGVLALFYFLGRDINIVLRGKRGEQAVARVLNRLGYPSFHNVFVEYGDRITQIDHVVLVGGRVLAIETKNYYEIYGAAGDGEWSLGDAARDRNPIKQNEVHIAALRKRLPGVTVSGVVVVMNFTEFPKGDIPGVIRLEKLPLFLASLEEAADTAWNEDILNRLNALAAQEAQKGLAEKHERYLLRTHVEKGAMIANQGPKGEAAKPSNCKKCGGTEFMIVDGKTTQFTWKCTSCSQWHLLDAGRDNVRRDGRHFYLVSSSGVERLFHVNKAVSATGAIPVASAPKPLRMQISALRPKPANPSSGADQPRN